MRPTPRMPEEIKAGFYLANDGATMFMVTRSTGQVEEGYQVARSLPSMG